MTVIASPAPVNLTAIVTELEKIVGNNGVIKRKTDLETMQWVRQCFNPQNLANPGKLFPTPRTCGESANVQRQTNHDKLDVY